MRSSAKYIMWLLLAAFIGGFLLYESAGLAGLAGVTTTTPVATVNGEEILYVSWQEQVSALEQQEQQRLGRAVTLDERRTLEDQAFNDMVNDLLLQQEYKRRGITVTDDEIRQAALNAPPPQAMQSAELQTDGRFDIDKYRRLLSSPQSRQSGMLQGLEQYYRSEIPKQKLFEQVASDVYVTEDRLWQVYRDRNDSAQVSFVVMRSEMLTDTAVTVTDGEISTWYEARKQLFDRPARAVVSLLSIPRTITAADSAAARARIERVRSEITGGAKFEEVAARESADSVSAAQGGSLGRGTLDRFDPAFAGAARGLAIGELSQPVLSSFGWHLIRVDSRKGDTTEVRHILVPVQQTDSSALRTDRMADSLAKRAANLTEPKGFDDAAKQLGITPVSAVVIDKEPLTFAGQYVPSVSAWAFSGVRPGETSDLFDSPDAYYIARVDSLTAGGQQPLAEVRSDIVRRITREKRLEKLRPMAAEFASKARASSLEAAAAERNIPVEKSPTFSRVDIVQGLGQFVEAIGAAFTIPVGSVGGPVKAVDGMAVMRVDRRVEANRAAFTAQKDQQSAQLLQSLRQQRVQEYLANLRKSVSIEDDRAKVLSTLRRQDSGT
ncbi:MAG: peptidyl-prolyl cis-trans isomerase [Gemmatimonadota bacterium]